MDRDKAIRAALLTAKGIKNRNGFDQGGAETGKGIPASEYVDMSWSDYLDNLVRNAPSSIANLVSDTVDFADLMTNPARMKEKIEFAKNLTQGTGQLAYGAGSKVARNALGYEGDPAGEVALDSAAAEMAGHYGLGQPGEFWKNLAEDPASYLGDAAAVLSGGTGATMKALKAIDDAQLRQLNEFVDLYVSPKQDVSTFRDRQFYEPSSNEISRMGVSLTPDEAAYWQRLSDSDTFLKRGVSAGRVADKTGILRIPRVNMEGDVLGDPRELFGATPDEMAALRPDRANYYGFTVNRDVKPEYMEDSGYFLPNPGREELWINPNLSKEQQDRTEKHEMTHADQYITGVPQGEGGTGPDVAARDRLDSLNSLNSRIRETTDPTERARLNDQFKTLRQTSPLELYFRNPGEMLANLASGEKNMVKQLNFSQSLNPYINKDKGPLERVADAVTQVTLADTTPLMTYLQRKNILPSVHEGTHRGVPIDVSKAIVGSPFKSRGGAIELARHATAVGRAGGQIAPSKYMPNVPRAVHADGGAANAPMFQGIHPDLQDESGAPLNLYHGTPQGKEFEAFDDAKLGERDAGFHGRGHYLTPSMDTANEYTMGDGDQGEGMIVGPLHAALKNPYIWDVSDDMKSNKTLRDLQSMGIMRGQEKLKPWDNLQQHHIQPFMAEMKKRGHDGVVVKTGHEWLPNGISEVVAFDPKTIKHTDAEAFDPTDPRIRREDGGEVDKATGGQVMGYVPMASLTVPRLAVARAPQYQQQAPVARFSESLNSLMDTVEGFKKKPEADVASGTIAMPDDGYEATGMYAPFQSAIDRMVADAPGKITVASGYRTPEEQEALWNEHAAKYPDPEVRDDYVARAGQSSHNYGLAADLSYADEETLKWAQENAPRYGLNFRMGHEDWHIEPANIWELRNSMTVPGYASGGRTLDKSGLYSKALEVARSMQQKRGTPEQFMAQLKNSKGVKPAEIEAIGMPTGEKITRDDFVQHITSKVPKLSTTQYGENPHYLHHGERQFLSDTWMEEDLSPKDEDKRTDLLARRDASPFHERDVFGDDIEPGYKEYSTDGGDNYRERIIKLGGDDQYQSSHWRLIPNVLAHIRMKDRDAPNGDRLLHVEEIQSDWGQQGREKGFHDPKNPYEVYRVGTNEVVSRHPDYGSMWDAYRTHPENNSMNYGDARERKIPAAPYVQNTQHWTDLAMKHIMREAALGDYDGVIFTPGQVHADRYGMEDASGMKGYYDNIVPKSALSIAQQHDPSIKPQTMNVNGEYDATHVPLTGTAKESILKNGFPMFNRGGAVDGKAEGGSAMDNNNQNGEMENGTTPINFATRPQAGELPDAGGIRGGTGVLQAQNEAPLEGLPQEIIIPMTGQIIQASADPRIRQVARDYMAQAGLPYSPPTKYARFDPKRAARIASDYTNMEDNPDDPLTKASYNAMIKETMDQYHAAKKSGLNIEFWNPRKQEDPYKASPRLATEDVRRNHHMWVFPTYSGYGSGEPISEDDAKKNPLLQLTGETWNGIPVTVNDVFRAIHDYYGHAKEGLGFRADGEENAWRAHASMFSPLARMAMTSETRGQNSWLNYGPHGEHNRKARTEDTIFAPQKIGVLSHLSHHEGAEDFIKPEEISLMASIRSRFGKKLGGAVDAALSLTRRFTKDGKSAISALKTKGK